MKIDKRSHGKTKLIVAIIAIAILVVIAAGAIYVYAFSGKIFGWTPLTTTSSTIDYSPPTKDQIDAGNQAKSNTVTNTPANPKTDGNNDTPPADNPPTTAANNIGVTITAASQNGSVFQIRTLISTVSSSGTCTLTLSKTGASSVVKTAGVQPLANSTTCQGFDVATSELSAGSWTATVVYKQGTDQGTASQTVLIK
jgi:flagellar basal body-associated protein FliL